MLTAKTANFDRYREALLGLRSHLDAQATALVAEVDDAFDAADRAEHQADIALKIGLANHEATIRKEVDDALDRIDSGAFGICERCQAAISARRLRALPYARYCVRCEREKESAVEAS